MSQYTIRLIILVVFARNSFVMESDLLTALVWGLVTYLITVMAFASFLEFGVLTVLMLFKRMDRTQKLQFIQSLDHSTKKTFLENFLKLKADASEPEQLAEMPQLGFLGTLVGVLIPSVVTTMGLIILIRYAMLALQNGNGLEAMIWFFWLVVGAITIAGMLDSIRRLRLKLIAFLAAQ